MKYLLDTGVWLWTVWEPERLTREARAIFESNSHEIFLSAVTSWEVSIKCANGKLKLPEPPPTYVPRRMADQGLRPLPVSHQHALAVFSLPAHHGDPFDRLLIAQANLEGMMLITADRLIRRYQVEVVWAGK